MITDAIINLIGLILDLLPDFHFSVITIPDAVISIINTAWLFLPMDTIAYLFGVTVSITVFRIMLALILRIKSFIPGWGN